MRLSWMRRGVRRTLLGRRAFDVCYDDWMVLDGCAFGCRYFFFGSFVDIPPFLSWLLISLVLVMHVKAFYLDELKDRVVVDKSL